MYIVTCTHSIVCVADWCQFSVSAPSRFKVWGVKVHGSLLGVNGGYQKSAESELTLIFNVASRIPQEARLLDLSYFAEGVILQRGSNFLSPILRRDTALLC